MKSNRPVGPGRCEHRPGRPELDRDPLATDCAKMIREMF